jgi:hypothetical protein
MAGPPPPYSATTVSQNLTPQRDPVTQLSRYLLEIMAFSFHADYALLNHALGQHSASISITKSTLTDDERVELLRLALISKDLYGKHRSYQRLNTRDSDRSDLADAIVIPALQLDLSESYILELISTYAEHQCDETKRGHTLISVNIPYPLWVFRHLTLFLMSFGHHLDSHARIIEAVASNEDVRIVLGNAMKAYQEEELDIKKVPHWYNDKWPDEYGSWHDLWTALTSKEERKDIYGQVYMRKRELADEKRARRNN